MDSEPIDPDLLDSLDVEDARILPFLPWILQDLTELGSMPGLVVQLVRNHLALDPGDRVADLGCGKGAVLLTLAENWSFQGVGLDLVPDFISEANKQAQSRSLRATLRFEVGDLRDFARQAQDLDLLIYGHDSEVLGDVQQSLTALAPCLRPGGHLILEAMYREEDSPTPEVPTRTELDHLLNHPAFVLLDRLPWDLQALALTNQANTAAIASRANELVRRYPQKAGMFRAFVADQREECRLLENDWHCETLLLRQTSV